VHTPTDKRVFYKEARSLAASGFDVVHLAPGDEPCRVEDGVRLEVYPARPGIRQRFLALLRLYRRAAAVNADAYHCNEVDSWVVGVALKVLRRKAVVFDVHEHYPSTFAHLHCPGWLSGLASGGLRLAFRCLIPFTDYFVYAKQTVAQDFPNTEGRSVVVLNCAPLESEPARPVKPVQPDKPEVVAIHVGVIARGRGWPQLAEALRRVRAPHLRLKLIGTCTDRDPDDFRRTFTAHDLRDRVELHDWMPFEDMRRHVHDADIGLILFQPTVQNNVYAMPHKLFDYMRAQLPVILPEFAVEVAPIVRDAQCGLLIDSTSPQAIAEALDQLAADPQLRATYGENGYAAVVRTYNWESEFEKLLEVYHQLAARIGKGPARPRAPEADRGARAPATDPAGIAGPPVRSRHRI
jgi:glycosyltransferase involved in cell wall biosynthesis